MAGGWGSAKNGIRVGVFWDGIALSADGSQARLTSPRVRIDRGVNIVDSSNSLSVAGGAVDDDSWSNLNLDGSGEKTIKNVDYQWVNLTYGSTVTATFSATLTGVSYAGGTLTVSKTITFPARAVSAPAAPSAVTGTRVSDTQVTAAWTRNATTNAPYDSLSVERSTDGGAFVQLATVAGSATSYSDTDQVAANHSYVYRVRAKNASGYSGYGTSAAVYTTPAAPSALGVGKSGSTVTLTWTNNAPYASGFKVYHREGTGAYVLLASPSASPYVHSSVNTSVTHQYKVTAVRGALESAAVESGVVQLLAPPLAPTVTVDPVEDLDANDLDIYWTHNAVDSTAQTNASVRYRAVGAPTWTTITGLGTDDSYTIPAGTLANGSTYETQVQTKGDHASYSPWSASVLFKGSATPSVTVNAPGTEVGASVLTVEWTYSDPESTAQSAWQVTLYDDTDAVIGSWSGTGAADSFAVPVLLTNSTDYTVGVKVWDGDGLGSIEQLQDFTTDFLLPPVPTLLAEFSEETGTVELTVSVAAPGVDEVEAVRVQLSRDGVMLADSPITDAAPLTVLDRIPPLNAEPVYTATTISATPTAAVSDPLVVDTGSWWVFLNAGEGWAVQARLMGNPSVDVELNREKVLHQFAGRSKPVEYIGEARSRVLKLSGDVAGLGVKTERGTWQPWEAIADLPPRSATATRWGAACSARSPTSP